MNLRVFLNFERNQRLPEPGGVFDSEDRGRWCVLDDCWRRFLPWDSSGSPADDRRKQDTQNERQIHCDVGLTQEVLFKVGYDMFDWQPCVIYVKQLVASYPRRAPKA